MSGKIKILLAVLALGALVSVSYAFSSFGGSLRATISTATGLSGVVSDPCQLDTDKDGLPDCEETYWGTDFQNPDTDGDGFKDGEEVLSGHDPKKKGPDDFLGNKGNVTQQAATLLLGGMATGDLLPDSQKYQNSIATYSQALIDRYQANSQIPDVHLNIGSDRRADLLNYGMTAGSIVGKALQDVSTSMIPVIKTVSDTNMGDLAHLNTTNPEKYRSFLSAIDTQISALDTPITKLTSMTVPPSMAIGHQNVLILLRNIQQQYRLVHQVAQDPVQALMALQTLQTLTRSTSIDVAEDFAIRLDNAIQ